ncbi:hypothetical protein BN59_03522 [Legionella massiliensis]|uniref:Uncharacterized protein n=1 Tax=Legionella massiliensis TaxID=1034943 RepID=A0A078L553_9GAMM|nr:hypothetical protein [Legionella massiliensis]CDZ79204.1 hypothetical protein BN59_03522 [Legionella massiliensis]CEE14942.1 hypothetical protein BN1094_03522 [Legionella massiliensis]
MWYAKVVRLLLSKINQNESEQAHDFYKTFFAQIKELLFNTEGESESELALGTLEKLFSKFAGRNDNSVSLQEFSRYLLGLTLCYVKFDSDGEIYNKDFSVLLDNNTLLSALGLQETITGYTEDLANNRCEYKTHKGAENQKPPIPIQAQVLALNDLELMVLRDLQFDTRIDFDKLVTVFDQVESWPVMSSFFAEAARYIEIKSRFTGFISIVYQRSGEKRDMRADLELHESHFFVNMMDFKTLITEYEPNEQIVLQMNRFAVALIIANYAYLIQPNCHSYWRFKTTAIEAVSELPEDFRNDPRLRSAINKIIFSVLSIGQFQPMLKKDKNPLTEVESNFILQLNKFNKHFHESSEEYQQYVDNLYVYLSESFIYFLRDKTAVNYFVFRSSAIAAIRRVSQLVNNPSDRKLMEQLEFSLLGLEMRYHLLTRKCQSLAEQEFVKFLWTLSRKIAEVKLAQIQEGVYLSSNLGVLEDFVSELVQCSDEYISNKRSFSLFKEFTGEIAEKIQLAKPGLIADWSNDISILERLTVNLKMSWIAKPEASDSQTTSEIVVSEEERDFLILLDELITTSADYISQEIVDENCNPEAGLIDALVTQLDTTTSTYLQYKTAANFRVFKMILQDTIVDYVQKIGFNFKFQLGELLTSLGELTMPVSNYGEGQRNSIFSYKDSQDSDSEEDFEFANKALGSFVS